MKKLLLAMFLFIGCGVETKLPEYDYDEVYIMRPIDKIENMQWSELYVTQDSVYHRYLYTVQNGEKILLLEISY